MSKFLKQIRSLKKINKSIITNNKFLINKEPNIKIYYAPFDYINPKAKIVNGHEEYPHNFNKLIKVD